MKKTRKQLAEQGVEDEDTLLTEGDEGTEDQADDNGGEEERGSLLFDEADGDGADGDGADGSDGEDEEDEAEDEDDEGLASKPRRKAPSRRKKMSEGETAELVMLREQMAEMRYRLYEGEVDKTIEGWGKGRFQFSETARKQLGEAEGNFAAKGHGAKVGRIALSKAFADEYRRYMRESGIRLSEPMRDGLNRLLEVALSSAIVDLSERGSSFDMEARMTRRGGQGPASEQDVVRLDETAERMAQAEFHKSVVALTDAQKLDVYTRAGKAIGYR